MFLDLDYNAYKFTTQISVIQKSPVFIVVTPRGDGGVDFAKPEEEPIERGPVIIEDTRQYPGLQVNRESGRQPPVTTAAVSVYKEPLLFCVGLNVKNSHFSYF